MSNSIPAAIAAALESVPSDAGIRLETSAGLGNRGEVVVVTSPSGDVRRVVAVTSLDETDQVVRFVLGSTYLEAASDLDLIHRASTQGSYDLVFLAELYGEVFVENLGELVDHLAPPAVAAIAQSLVSDGDSMKGFEVGMPLGAPDDPRRRFRQMELDVLSKLTSACRSWRSGTELGALLVDPEELAPPRPGATPEEVFACLDAVLAILEELESTGQPFAFDVFLGNEDAVSELARWHREFGFDLIGCLHGLCWKPLALIDEAPTPSEGSTFDEFLEGCAENGVSTCHVVSAERTGGAMSVIKKGSGYCRPTVTNPREQVMA